MANANTEKSSRVASRAVAQRAAEILNTDIDALEKVPPTLEEQQEDEAQAALEAKADTAQLSSEVAKANEKAKDAKEPEMSPADHMLADTAKVLLEYVKTEKIDERHHDIAWAIVQFLNERKRKTNGVIHMTLKELRQHTFQLIGYKQSKNAEERKRQESPAFEMLVTRGIREGLLAFEGFKEATLIKDEDTGNIMFMAPSNQLAPKLDLLDPHSGRVTTQIDNPNKTLVKVPVAKVTDLFNEAFPGNVRAANHKGEKETATDQDESDKLAKVSTIKLATAMTLRVVALEGKLEEEGKKPSKEITQELELLFNTLDHFMGLLDASNKEKKSA